MEPSRPQPSVSLKRLFDVVLADGSGPAEGDALILLADNEAEARSLVVSPIAEILVRSGLVSVVGGSRVVGWTRTRPLPALPEADSNATEGEPRCVPRIS
jgi:hypothetical protein